MGNSIPLSIPNFEGNEKKYVVDAIDGTWVSTNGSYNIRFEKMLAEFLKVSNVAVCQSGTSTLHLSLREAGVSQGDIVLVLPLTFIAAVNPVKYQFATPVFIDCDDSLCMDPVKLREFCETKCLFRDGVLKYKGQTVKALVIVHVFGNMADMEPIMDIAETYNLKVIEDATEALGTHYLVGKYAGKFAGTIGHFGAFSFNGNKIITTGGGGAITANDPKVVDHLRYLSTQAKDNPNYYIHHEVGYNYRMTNLQVALGVAQMEELPEFIKRKQVNYVLYKNLFEDFELAEVMSFREGTYSNKWFYSLKIDRSRITSTMCEIMASLEKEGIQSRAIWRLINEQKPYEGEETYKLEKAPYYASRVLNLPSSTQITKEEIIYVADKVKQLLKVLANG